MKLSQIKRLYKEFGPEIAFSAAGASRFRSLAPWKHRCILRYLREAYAPLIAQYQQGPKGADRSDSQAPGTIWTVWWQGEDNLPEVVRLCHASVRRHCGDHPFKVLTQANYQEYVTLPGCVMEKFQAGAITITHLSDIIRFALLSQYGGLWLDSTVFVADRIPEDVFTAEYYTVRRALTPRNRNVAQDRWTNFLHAGQKGNVLSCFVFDFFIEYWKTQPHLIDYFLIDYAIELAYEELLECKKLLDAVPICEDDLYRLEDIMNKEWNPSVFESIRTSALFSKLAWRKNGRKKILGKETIYGHLLALAEAMS
ncbi:MAG: capsular polysaccharide synthesis protein [Fretibacterium sp.]|nr:capsular polysaccharide synthesis protein [Fretibacterium sp.]